MKDIEFLNEVNDRVVLSVDEPIYQSTERFIHTMSEQLELSPQQIKEALDFQYLARRQRQLARPLIEAFVRSHPYAEGMPAEQYAQELLQAHPGINASMVEAYFQEASKAADVAAVETSEAPAAEATTEEAAVTPETVSSEASPAGEVPASEATDAGGAVAGAAAQRKLPLQKLRKRPSAGAQNRRLSKKAGRSWLTPCASAERSSSGCVPSSAAFWCWRRSSISSALP